MKYLIYFPSSCLVAGAINVLFVSLLIGCDSDKFTLNIFGEGKQTIGADVFVNGKPMGTMKEFGDEKGSHFAVAVSKGTLTVEVRKEGYSSYREVITVAMDASEHYVYVTLSPLPNGKRNE